ncbi:MAG: hypothetical protein ABI413_10300 [Ktedonobacteraceae bacterium]
MITNTPPTTEISTHKRVITQPVHVTFGHARKAGLLFFLCSGLALLVMLHIAIGYIPSVPPVAATCANLMSSTDYTQAVGFQPANQQMAAVQMVNNLTDGSPAALVQVTTPNLQNALDAYVFGCSIEHNQPQVHQLFSQQGLSQGTVELTPEHTLLTAALDTKLSPNTIPFLQPLQQNIYREYAWHAGRFAQVLFPGLYPVASRSEAQALQQNFNNGQQLLWHDPLATSQQMAKDLLHWSQASSALLVSQTGDTALVELTSQSPRVTIEVTLQQMIQPGSNGLWFVTDAHTKGMLLMRAGTSNEPFPQTATSPMSFSGANALTDGHTSATLFDHTLTPLSHASSVPLTVQPNSAYSGTLTYSGVLPGQQGVLLIESLPQTKNQAKEPGQLLLTSVILD